MGMGFAMAQQMGQMFSQQNQANQQSGPPPIPGGNIQFYIAVNGAQQGPYTPQTLQQMIQQGSVNRDSLVWRQGIASWIKASDAPEISGFFGAVPPPLPPQ
ncbi:MAG: DUF4339 domain-containing protein, partial [Chryseolinea sp.]